MRHLTAAQPALYAYVVSLLLDRASAQDVLQEANITLWRRWESFSPGTNFMAWAYRVAYFHVLSHRRQKSRDRLVFDDDVLDYLAERQIEREDNARDMRKALGNCLERLPRHSRQLIDRRYETGGSVQRIADEQGRSVGSVSQALYRIREELANCIRGALAQTSSSA